MTPAAVLAYAITFLFTDIVSEVYGYETAKKVVWYGFLSQLLVLLLVQFALWLPAAPWQVEFSSCYASVLGSSWFIVLASLIAYLLSQMHDVAAFDFWKRKTHGRWLWLRNNASTMVSQLIDTAVFITLGFGILPFLALGSPLLPWTQLPSLILGQYVVKWLIALVDTPFCYLGVWLVKKQ